MSNLAAGMKVAVLAAGVLLMFQYLRDPHRTALPMEVADLSPIEPQLQRLNAEERALVVGYLKRSNGDVLPAQFADPDEPLTARTFAQAIVLQRDFLEKKAVRDAEAAARQARIEASRQPLRAAISLRLIKRELLTSEQIYGPPQLTNPKQGRIVREHEPLIQVMTYRLTNRSQANIAAFSGSAEIPGVGLMPAAGCWIDQREELAANDSREVRCGNPNRPANEEERLTVTRPISEISLHWNPVEVRFADGRVLKAER